MTEQIIEKAHKTISPAEHQVAEKSMAAIAAIDTIIQSIPSVDLALAKVIDKVFRLFQSDRAWLYVPCDPDAASFRVVYETTHPDFSGAKALNTAIPMNSDVSRNCRRALANPFTALLDPSENRDIGNSFAKGFNVQSMMYMAIRPRIGDAWMLGLHQCDYRRVWTSDEQQLFKAIGHRIADLLSQKYYLDQLDQSEQRYLKVLETSPDPIFIHQNGRFLFANPATAKLIGVEKVEDLIGKLSTDFVDESLMEKVRQRLDQVNRERKELPFIELKLHRPDGKIVYVESASIPTVYQGQPAAQVFARDITDLKDTIRQLKANNKRFQLIEDNIIDVLFVADDKMNFTYYSPSVQRLLGYTPDEMLTLPLEKYIVPEFLSPVLKQIEKRLSLEQKGQGDDESRTWILQYIRKDGQCKWGELITTPMRADDGRFTGLFGVIRDIDQRRQAQEALQESKTRYKTLVDHINSGVAVYQAVDDGADFIFVDFNKAGQEIEQISKAQVIGRRVGDVFPHVREFGIFEVFQRVWRTGVAEHFPMAMYQDNRISGWRDNFIYKLPTGEIVAVYTDETERCQNHQRLEESEQRLKTILSSVQTGIIIIDQATHQIVDVNPAAVAMIGDERNHIIGQTCHTYIKSNVSPITEPGCADIQNEQVLHKVNGSSIPVLQSVSPIIIGGRPHLLVNFVDITERKQLEARLVHAQKMESIGNLAGGIAHDFNNILFPIVGMADLLIEDLPQGSAEQMQVKQILKAGQRASELVNQILAFSRQSETTMIPLYPDQILKDVISLCRSTIPADIPIVQEFENNCGMIMADPTQLHQIAMNLITNAYHAVENTGGWINVRLEKMTINPDNLPSSSITPGPWVRLSVIDSGCGIEPAVLEHIFEPYFTTKARGKGTGLGLAVVYGLVKDHGGDIQVTSDINKGSTFAVYLPAYEDRVAEIPAKHEDAQLAGTESILLVDDEAAIVDLEQIVLQRYGYRTEVCTSSIDALIIFKSKPDQFDLVITDMSMPNMTGAQLAKALLRIRPDVPIILCTGYSERIDPSKAKTIGIKGFLMKPVVKNELARMVRDVLDNR